MVLQLVVNGMQLSNIMPVIDLKNYEWRYLENATNTKHSLPRHQKKERGGQNNGKTKTNCGRGTVSRKTSSARSKVGVCVGRDGVVGLVGVMGLVGG